ncbi:hypothetical protein CEP51_014684 [Fusarium floridanum]|uniref:Uncharacterized protein n=1 Tax=Fusarium floridanum TaxID=1325733 RepID=A0A428PNI5_9HYPO|nr:hypothetical protein CEP51_014684 [Fusarium floridanum]
MQGGIRPDWNYFTYLTFPNLFTHAGLQDPSYRATAGVHIFCRLDQQGCLAKQVTRFSRGQEYVLWQDMTPKNLDFFFRDTQFSGGSWHRYKAVEAFDFDREDAAVAFLDRHRDKITENGNRQVTFVVGERDDMDGDLWQATG